MKQWIIGSAIAVTLPAGIFVFWPRDDARSGQSAVPVHNRVPLHAGLADRSFTELRRNASMPATSNGFREQAAEIAATPPTTERENAIRELAHEWAAENPAAAERWAAAFDDPQDRERAMTHVCLEVAGHDPLAAIEMAQWQKLNPGTVDSIVEQWAKSDFAAAEEWVRELTDEKLRENALIRLAHARAETFPAEAAAMVSTSLAAGPAQEEAAIAVLHQWLRQDAEAAHQWVEVFPDGPLKERARAEIHGMISR